MTKRFVMNNPNEWGFPITDNVTGKVYSCDSNILMKDLCGVVNAIVDENEQLKSENIQLTIDNKELKCTNNELYQENEQLKSTLYFLLNVIQNKCPKDYPKCKEIVRSCFENDSTNSRNDGDVE